MLSRAQSLNPDRSVTPVPIRDNSVNLVKRRKFETWVISVKDRLSSSNIKSPERADISCTRVWLKSNQTRDLILESASISVTVEPLRLMRCKAGAFRKAERSLIAVLVRFMPVIPGKFVTFCGNTCKRGRSEKVSVPDTNLATRCVATRNWTMGLASISALWLISVLMGIGKRTTITHRPPL